MLPHIPAALSYVPLPARTWQDCAPYRPELVRFSGQTMAAAPLAPPCRQISSQLCHPERNVVKSKDLRIGKSVRTFGMRTDLLVRRSFDALSLAQDDIEGEFVRLFYFSFS